MADKKTLRWGIAAAGKISHDFCVGLSTLPQDDHQVTVVAARDQQRAAEFAKKHNITHAYGSYAELAASPEVDIVYIGVLNPQHYEVSMLMLEHGKHVLCEKPLCMNAKEARKLIQYAERKKLFLMEAVWSRFFPAYQYLKKQIDTGILGEILEVNVNFGVDIVNVDRVSKKDMGGGVVLDLGIYTIQCCQWAFREPPVQIVSKGELNSEGVDIHVESEFRYTSGRTAKMVFSAKGLLNNQAVIKGSNGSITLIDFWCPTKIIDIDGREKEWVLPSGSYSTNFKNSEGLRYEAEAVRQCILEKKIQNEFVCHNESLLFAKMQDEIRKQIGGFYEVDQGD